MFVRYRKMAASTVNAVLFRRLVNYINYASRPTHRWVLIYMLTQLQSNAHVVCLPYVFRRITLRAVYYNPDVIGLTHFHGHSATGLSTPSPTPSE